jgi:aminopeptidase N
VTTADFIALSEQVSGQQLDELFDVWLYEEGRPAVCDA